MDVPNPQYTFMRNDPISVSVCWRGGCIELEVANEDGVSQMYTVQLWAQTLLWFVYYRGRVQVFQGVKLQGGGWGLGIWGVVHPNQRDQPTHVNNQDQCSRIGGRMRSSANSPTNHPTSSLPILAPLKRAKPVTSSSGLWHGDAVWECPWMLRRRDSASVCKVSPNRIHSTLYYYLVASYSK